MDFFSKIDMFKQPVRLNIGKSENLSTHFGKLATFFIIFYIIYTVLRSDLVLHRNPTIKSENIRPLMRPPINFNYSNFLFAVGLFDINLTYVVDPTVATFSAGIFFLNNSDGKYIDTHLEMKLCEEADLVNAGKNLHSTDTHNLFCFHLKNETINLFGSFNEKVIQFLYLELTQCKNSSEKNFTCKSFEDQEQFLKGKYQDIIFQNDALEYSDYLHPIKKDSIKHYVLVDANLAKTVKTSLKHFSFESDDGFFFENLKREDLFLVESINYDFQINDLEKTLPLVRLEMLLDSQETKNSRRYQHIQDLLAEMGGVLNILILFGFFLIKIEIPYIMTKKISSELYSYNIDNNENLKKEIKEVNEERTPLFDLSSFNKSKSNEAAKPLIINDLPSPEVNLIAKKIIILKNESFADTKKLKMLSDLQNKENDANRRKIQYENIISSNRNRRNSKLTAKIPTLKGDEDTVYEGNLEVNEKIRMQRRSAISISNNEIITKPDSILKKQAKKISIMQIAINFTVNLKNKLNFKNFLELSAIKGKKNFPINFLAYLSIFFKCKRFRLKPRERLFLLGEKQIKKDLDIFKIINSMNDVEKLKMILLNDKQRYLFDLLQKPIITTKPINKELESNIVHLIVDGHQKKVNRSIAESYYKDLITNKAKSDIDKRILLLVDKNLINLETI